MKHVGTCGHSVSRPGIKCRECWLNRGPERTPEQKGLIGKCGHPVSRKIYDLCRACSLAQSRKDKPNPATEPTESTVVSDSGQRQEITRVTPTRVHSLEDLIALFEIDTALWEVERWVANKWEMAAKVGDEKQQEIQVTPLYQVKVWLRRKSVATLTMEHLRKALLEDIRAEIRQVRPAAAPRRRFVESGFLFEFTPFDLHLGKYAWADESVTNYDSDAAADLFNASLDFLLQGATRLAGGRLERILAVFGNDVAHFDGKTGTTTAGTRMDVDTRYIKVYRRICEIHRRAVDLLLNVAPVDVVVVAGNHDELTSFHLGEILATRYEGHRHVTVDNGPKLRKYYDFGTNLFGFTHGDSERVSELPLLMAREQPERWARCSSREWHLGHKHIAEKHEARGRIEQDIFSDKGVRIRRLASLSAHDAWHTKMGYTDRRACDAFIFHKEAGYTANLSFNIDHFSGRGLAPKKGAA